MNRKQAIKNLEVAEAEEAAIMAEYKLWKSRERRAGERLQEITCAVREAQHRLSTARKYAAESIQIHQA
jgi:hypothetical protein